MSNSFEISSKYDQNTGIKVEINNATVQLSVSDICYLLITIDEVATQSNNPPSRVQFIVAGTQYDFTNDEWHLLIDKLSSTAGAGGWNHLICEQIKHDGKQK
jgi:hypothetical protein